MTAFLSDELRATRDGLKDFRHGGKAFSSEEIDAFVRRFNTFVAMARELEDDFALAVRINRAHREQIVLRELHRPGTNVVALPRRGQEGGAA